MVNGSCGHAVDPAGKTAAQVVAEMGDALIRLAGEPERVPLAEGARLRCRDFRSEEHTSELQSLMRISYAVFCLKKKKLKQIITHTRITPRTNIKQTRQR